MYRRVAVLIDGGFYRKRFREVYGELPKSPIELAKKLHIMAIRHAGKFEDLYRIFYYDCPPLSKKAHNPISGRAIDFSKEPQAVYVNAYLEELKRKRKMALRLGRLGEFNEWCIRPRYTKQLVSGALDPKSLTEDDVYYSMAQKGVDMKIGIDIATLAFRQLVGKIILVAGDADFVPAAKLARREGIDFVLDPMWCHIDDELYEHVDGLESKCPDPSKLKKQSPPAPKHDPQSPPPSPE
jgi:uncharacterized LabA/DUF88 family protein